MFRPNERCLVAFRFILELVLHGDAAGKGCRLARPNPLCSQTPFSRLTVLWLCVRSASSPTGLVDWQLPTVTIFNVEQHNLHRQSTRLELSLGAVLTIMWEELVRDRRIHSRNIPGHSALLVQFREAEADPGPQKLKRCSPGPLPPRSRLVSACGDRKPQRPHDGSRCMHVGRAPPPPNKKERKGEVVSVPVPGADVIPWMVPAGCLPPDAATVCGEVARCVTTHGANEDARRVLISDMMHKMHCTEPTDNCDMFGLKCDIKCSQFHRSHYIESHEAYTLKGFGCKRWTLSFVSCSKSHFLLSNFTMEEEFAIQSDSGNRY
ncbi:hypothetical protein F2P81_022309 [Scophthalmus maximus]|uniref:Uncharacterized protein n=1 Tax=Scophthalmus maximus TaxID=52904 RepID=A0A6A4RZW8_SCOMX|nr:hypothetical protein F2P81_022309 [Scophthalmus maximus]